jgi:two-component system response regulator YesN
MLLDMFLGTGALREEGLLLDKLNEAFSAAMLAKMSATEWKKAASELLSKLEFAGEHHEAALQQLNEARAGIQEVRTEQARHAISTLIKARLTKASLATRMKNGRQLMEVVKQYIDLNYRDVTLDDIAQRFYMNKNYFCSLFKSTIGEGFVEYLTALRMEHAKRLLEGSELKTYEVADYVGYSDQRYFSQVFRKLTGMKPTEYRQFVRQQAE